MNKIIALILVVFTGAVVYGSAFTVNEAEQALVLRLGEHKRTITEAGLNFKVPLFENVVYLDKRILNLDVPEQELIISDQLRLVVDAVARFRIVDPLLTFQTRQNEIGAGQGLSPLLVANIREIFGQESLERLLSEERAGLMLQISKQVNAQAATFGVEMVDVRIRRVDLPDEIADDFYERMNSERKREATEIRAQGEEQARFIRAEADKQVTVILANAERDAQILRGEGDGQAVAIFANAYNKDKDFFEFYRAMQAYRKALGKDDTTLVLSPNSEFLKYLKSMDGRK